MDIENQTVDLAVTATSVEKLIGRAVELKAGRGRAYERDDEDLLVVSGMLKGDIADSFVQMTYALCEMMQCEPYEATAWATQVLLLELELGLSDGVSPFAVIGLLGSPGQEERFFIQAELFTGWLTQSGLFFCQEFMKYVRESARSKRIVMWCMPPQRDEDDEAATMATLTIESDIRELVESFVNFQRQQRSYASSVEITFANTGHEPSLPALDDRPQLSVAVQDACRQHGFRWTQEIEIVSNTAPRGGTYVRTADREAILPPRFFRLFLRLVVAHYLADDGYAARGNLGGGGLADEGYYDPASADQMVSELRLRLGDQRRTDGRFALVEVDGAGRIRLSLHRSLIRVDWSWLSSHHPDLKVRALALEVLPFLSSSG